MTEVTDPEVKVAFDLLDVGASVVVVGTVVVVVVVATAVAPKQDGITDCVPTG